MKKMFLLAGILLMPLLCIASDEPAGGEAAFAAALAELDTQIADGFDINEDQEGLFPLDLAAFGDDLARLRALITRGAPIIGGTALCQAALEGYLPIVETLVAAGANINVFDARGRTPLHLAASRGHSAVVEKLITCGADVETLDNDGRTPSHLAAEAGHSAIVEVLRVALLNWLEARIATLGNADVADGGSTLLQLAAERGNLAAVEFLIARGATVNKISYEKDGNDQPALHHAARGGHLAVVEALIARRACVNEGDRYCFTALQKAVYRGHAAVVELLLAHGAGSYIDERRHGGGLTALQQAVVAGHAAVVKLLLAHGAKFDAHLKDGVGYTVLHKAAALGHLAVVEVLLAHGASINLSILRAVAIGGGHHACFAAIEAAIVQRAQWSDAREGWCIGVARAVQQQSGGGGSAGAGGPL